MQFKGRSELPHSCARVQFKGDAGLGCRFRVEGACDKTQAGGAKLPKTESWNTFSLSAFACAYIPGGPDETRLLRLASTITGAGAAEPDDERMPVVRRLFFEAYTLAASVLRSRMEAREDDKPRKLANVEHTQRYEEQKLRLKGLDLVENLRSPMASLMLFRS